MVLSVAVRTTMFKQRSWNSFSARKIPLVSGNLYAISFLEGTRFPLYWVPLSHHLALLLECLERYAEHDGGGAMVGLEEHFLPGATILSEG